MHGLNSGQPLSAFQEISFHCVGRAESASAEIEEFCATLAVWAEVTAEDRLLRWSCELQPRTVVASKIWISHFRCHTTLTEVALDDTVARITNGAFRKMHVFLPDILDTAVIRDLEEEELLALCDFLDEAVATTREQVVTLRWTKQQFPRRIGAILYVVKVWVTPRGDRKLRLQCHKIYASGRLGTRNLLQERRNGRIVR